MGPQLIGHEIAIGSGDSICYCSKVECKILMWKFRPSIFSVTCQGLSVERGYGWRCTSDDGDDDDSGGRFWIQLHVVRGVNGSVWCNVQLEIPPYNVNFFFKWEILDI